MHCGLALPATSTYMPRYVLFAHFLLRARCHKLPKILGATTGLATASLLTWCELVGCGVSEATEAELSPSGGETDTTESQQAVVR
jgi:hypothetical protein